MEYSTIYTIGLTAVFLTLLVWIGTVFVKSARFSASMWLIANIFIFIGFLLGQFPDLNPSAALFPSIFGAVFGLSVVFFHIGMGHFVGNIKPAIVNSVIFGVVAVATLGMLHTGISPQVAILTMYSGFLAMLSIMATQGVSIVRRDRSSVIGYNIAAICLVVAASYALRLAMLFNGDMNVDESMTSGGGKFFVLSAAFLSITMNLSLVIALVEHMVSTAKKAAFMDHLTSLANRPRLESVMESEMNRSRRTGRPYSVMICDIDHFKKVNDTFGHFNGDKVLVNVAEMLSKTARNLDTVGRLGGEEFCIILPDTDMQGAVAAADRFRERVHETQTKIGAKKLRVTISIGVATYYNAHENWLEMLARADAALYNAKLNGRNRVEASDPNKISIGDEPDDSYEDVNGLSKISESVMEIRGTQSSYDRIKSGNTSMVTGMMHKNKKS